MGGIIILLIEGNGSTRPSYHKGLVNKGYEVYSVPNGSSAIELFNHETPDVIVIDSSTMRTNGKRICQSLKNKAPNIPIILITNQPQAIKEGFQADIILIEPFTIKKLVNRIQNFAPTKNTSIFKVGPFELDEESRMARCDKKQARLTPRLVALLKHLMEKPNEVVERKELFLKVWETDYLGDTRPLDVHISWLRQKLEENPRESKYIKTIRGVGYFLDIPSDSDTAP